MCLPNIRMNNIWMNSWHVTELQKAARTAWILTGYQAKCTNHVYISKLREYSMRGGVKSGAGGEKLIESIGQ